MDRSSIAQQVTNNMDVREWVKVEEVWKVELLSGFRALQDTEDEIKMNVSMSVK